MMVQLEEAEAVVVAVVEVEVVTEAAVAHLLGDEVPIIIEPMIMVSIDCCCSPYLSTFLIKSILFLGSARPATKRKCGNCKQEGHIRTKCPRLVNT